MQNYRIRYAEALVVRRRAREAGYGLFIDGIVREEEVAIYSYVSVVVHDTGIPPEFLALLEELDCPPGI